METVTAKQPFNETQILLLQIFSNIKTEQEKNDIQALLLDYYRKRVDKGAKEVHLSNEQIDEILNSHYRTTYK
jgi:DNA replication protein DnaC